MSRGWGVFFIFVFVVVVNAVTVSAQGDTFFFYLFICGGKSFPVYEVINSLLVWVIFIYVMKVDYGWV